MIGQNVFSGTNSNANLDGAIFGNNPATSPTNIPPVPDRHISNNHTNPTTPAMNVPPKRSKSGLSLFVIIFLAALAGAGLFAGVYFLLIKPKENQSSDSAIVESYDYIPDSNGNKPYTETIKEYDDKITNAKNDEEKLSLTLSKAGYYTMVGECDEAIAILNTIDASSLSAYDQYRLYGYYVGAYEDKGDLTEAGRYQALADEAMNRDFETATEEALNQ